MSFSADAASSGVVRRGGNPLVVRCYRLTRTCVHVLAGVATTLFVFPLVSDARRRMARQALERPAPAHPQGRRAPARRARRAGGNVLVVANHISWLDIFVLNAHHPVRFVAKAEIAHWPVLSQHDPRRRHAVHRPRERGATRIGVIQEIARVLRAAATSSRSFRKARRPTAPTCCRSRARCCSRSSTAKATCSRWRSAIARRRRALAMRAGIRGRHDVLASRSGACAASARWPWTSSRDRRCPRRGPHRRDLARAAEASIRTALAEPAARDGT